MTVFAIRSLFMATESAFGSASTDWGDYTRLDASQLEWTVDADFIERPIAAQYLGLNFDGLVGAKSGVLNFRLPLRGLVSRPNGSVPGALEPSLESLLHACGFESYPFPGATTTQAGSTTEVVVVNDTSGFLADGVPALINGEVRAVTLIGSSPPSLTVSPPLETAPPEGAIVAAPVVTAPANTNPDEGLPSLSFIVEADGYGLTLSGCCGKMKLVSLAMNEQPSLEFEFTVTDWTEAMPATGVPADAGALSDAGFIPMTGARAGWGASLLGLSAFEFDPAVELKFLDSMGAEQGRGPAFATTSGPKGTFTTDYDATLRSDYQTMTTRALSLQLGTRPGNILSLFAPRVQLTTAPKEVEEAGLSAMKSTMRLIVIPETGDFPPLFLSFF